jgi:hypothetical protein
MRSGLEVGGATEFFLADQHAGGLRPAHAFAAGVADQCGSVLDMDVGYRHMTRTIPGADLKGSVIEIDSYGGAINRNDLLETTSAAQRASVLKLQLMTFWSNEDEDAARLVWIRDLYKDLYSGPEGDPQHNGTPYWGARYEGCYINYPDVLRIGDVAVLRRDRITMETDAGSSSSGRRRTISPCSFQSLCK